MKIATPKSKSKSKSNVVTGAGGVSLPHAKPISHKSGSNARNVISVEDYADDRELQQAKMASLSHPPQSKGVKRRRRQNIIDLSLDLDDDDDDVQFLNPPSLKTETHFKSPFKTPSIVEIGESSNSKAEPPITTFMCEICVDEKPNSECFSIVSCSHSYCSDCMIKYVASKIQENITQIRCPVPNYSGLLEPEHCRSILPPEVFDRWGSALCESVILASEKFYCPYKDCSALLVDDGGGNGGEVITASECPNCRRLFCAQCKVLWHSDIQCDEFQKLNNDERGREDIMLMQLAKEQKWMRCPLCKYYVERSEGCEYMRCRCGNLFCYICGETIEVGTVGAGGHICRKYATEEQQAMLGNQQGLQQAMFTNQLEVRQAMQQAMFANQPEVQQAMFANEHLRRLLTRNFFGY